MKDLHMKRICAAAKTGFTEPVYDVAVNMRAVSQYLEHVGLKAESILAFGKFIDDALIGKISGYTQEAYKAVLDEILADVHVFEFVKTEADFNAHKGRLLKVPNRGGENAYYTKKRKSEYNPTRFVLTVLEDTEHPLPWKIMMPAVHAEKVTVIIEYPTEERTPYAFSVMVMGRKLCNVGNNTAVEVYWDEESDLKHNELIFIISNPEPPTVLTSFDSSDIIACMEEAILDYPKYHIYDSGHRISTHSLHYKREVPKRSSVASSDTTSEFK